MRPHKLRKEPILSATSSPPAGRRVVETREAFRVLGEWADTHYQDSKHETVVSELEKLGDKSVWDDPSRANEVAGRLNTLLTLINSNVRTAAAVLTPATPPAQTTTPSAQPAPNPPAWTPPANPPARTTTPPAQPAPNVGIIAGVAAGIAAVGCIIAGVGAVAGIGAVGAASAGVAVGIIAGVAVRAAMRGGAVAGIIVGVVGVVGVAAGIIAGVAGVAVGIVVGVGVGLIAGVGVFVGVDSAARAIIADGAQRPQR